MSLVEDRIDLPGLQHRLNGLARGERLSIGVSTFRRLFGGEHGEERLAHFARGHGCGVDASPSRITFVKMDPVIP